MRALDIVMAHPCAQNVVELGSAEADEGIKAFTLYGADEGFCEGIRIRRPVRYLDDAGRFRCPDGIEAAAELGVSVTDQETRRDPLMSHCPILLTAPSRALPPVDRCRGTKPRQAAKLRPLSKVERSGAKPLSEMTRDELEEEVQILRAVISRLDGLVTTTDIIRADRDRDDTVLHSRGLEKPSRFKGRCTNRKDCSDSRQITAIKMTELR